MIRTMLSSVAVAATLSMAVSGHALSGDVDGRDFLIWQRGGSPAKAKTNEARSSGHRSNRVSRAVFRQRDARPGMQTRRRDLRAAKKVFPLSGTTAGRVWKHLEVGQLLAPPRNAPGLPADQRAFAGEAPMVAAEAAVAAQNTVTGHHERDRVAADG